MEKRSDELRARVEAVDGIDDRKINRVAVVAFGAAMRALSRKRKRTLSACEWACALALLRGKIDGVFQAITEGQDPDVLDALDEATVEASKNQRERTGVVPYEEPGGSTP